MCVCMCMYVGEGVARSAGYLQRVPEAASLVVAVSVSGQLQPGDVQPDILLRSHDELLRPKGIHQRAVCMYVCMYVYVCMYMYVWAVVKLYVCMYVCMYGL